ncbi:uncharacterized protein METZ01_LOCUS103154 [marine metagenome]|uniref:Uncharacterized protein n=1 Tax=marine metagenome TaxID=408172 RepID=A0A381WCP3_9ZZZZ
MIRSDYLLLDVNCLHMVHDYATEENFVLL